MPLTLDQLFPFADASPDLDRLETVLRQTGHAPLADTLCKFQQDVGVAIDREINGYDAEEPAAGPLSAALDARFSPPTVERVEKLFESAQHFPDTAEKNMFIDLLNKVRACQPPAAAPAAKGPQHTI
jgi:hypothetical protein